MIVRTLGAGAGGGLPQWNCGCRNCALARAGAIPEMTQSSVAVSPDGDRWIVLNASPDLRAQLAAAPPLHPRGLRDTPIAAVIVTNADVDHVAGLLTLREKTGFDLWATPGTRADLAANPIFGVLDPTLVIPRTIALHQPFEPLPGLQVTAYPVPGKVALYMEGAAPNTRMLGEQTIGLRIEAKDRVFHYIPGCAEVTDDLVARLADADLLFFDGTVWRDDEMPASGTGAKTGARMGHIAMSGPSGSLARLAGMRALRRFIHVNNTNPALDPASAERAALRAAGWDIVQDQEEIRP